MEDDSGKFKKDPRFIRLTNNVSIPPGETYKLNLGKAINIALKNDKEFQELRGYIINNSLYVEEHLDMVISNIIVPGGTEGNRLLRQIILQRDSFGFMNKWKTLRDLLKSSNLFEKKDFKELITDIKEIIDIRNKFAHGQLSHAGDGSDIMILEYFKERLVKEEIKVEEINNFDKVMSRCLQGLKKLTSDIIQSRPDQKSIS